MADTPLDPIVEAVRADLLRRSQVGVAKYGVMLNRQDLDLRDWLQHAYEEALDLANYLKRSIMEIDAAAGGTEAPPPRRDRERELLEANNRYLQDARDARAEVRRLSAENDHLRASLANGPGPCAYCHLSREDWAKCRSGFPGCGRADDAMLCPHVGAELAATARAEAAEAALEPLWQRAVAPGAEAVPDDAPVTVFMKDCREAARVVPAAAPAASRPNSGAAKILRGLDEAVAWTQGHDTARIIHVVPVRERVRHRKRGTVYEVLARGVRLQGDAHEPETVVLYRGEDGTLWAREETEFDDGRFEAVAPVPSIDVAPSRDWRQEQMRDWITRIWTEDALALHERVERLLEETIELAQAEDLPVERIATIARHVYAKAPGEPGQEIGGISTCLLAYCAAKGLSAEDCERRELARILAKPVEHFRARHQAKVEAGMAQGFGGADAF